MQIDARRRMPLASLGSNNIYPKGALVLEMLHNYLGDQRFWAGINRYLTTHAFGVAVSDESDMRFAVSDLHGLGGHDRDARRLDLEPDADWRAGVE